MKISITTQARNGHSILYIINNKDVKILTVNDSNHGECLLDPGIKYRIEWHFWNAASAEYSIKAEVNPQNQGFPPFDKTYSYLNSHHDMGGFPFTI